MPIIQYIVDTAINRAKPRQSGGDFLISFLIEAAIHTSSGNDKATKLRIVHDERVVGGHDRHGSAEKIAAGSIGAIRQ
jgi:hypothetical protein